MKWRIIPFHYYNPFLKIALNEVAINSVSSTNQSLFWICGWNQNCINLGAGQNYSKILHQEKIRKDNVLVVRRQGGGGATYLSKEGEISWALVYPNSKFNVDNLERYYEENLQFLINTLQKLGIQAKYKKINDVITNKGKISGSTLKYEKGVVYFAGTLIYTIEKTKLEEYLFPEKDNYKPSLPEKQKKISSILDFTTISYDDVIEHITQEFLKDKEAEVIDWTSEELEQANKLVDKYSSESWIKYGKL